MTGFYTEAMSGWADQTGGLPSIENMTAGSASFSATLGKIAPTLMVVGALSSALAAHSAAKTAANQQKMMELQLQSKKQTLAYQSEVSKINASIAEMMAEQTMLSRDRATAINTLRQGQERSSARASLASRGVSLDYGSSSEIMASMEFAKQTDMLAINSEAVRTAESIRMRKNEYESSAKMLDSYSGSMFVPAAYNQSPTSSAFSSLLGSAIQFAPSFIPKR